jgi:hypothetical protein
MTHAENLRDDAQTILDLLDQKPELFTEASRQYHVDKAAALLAGAEALEACEKAKSILHAYGDANEGTAYPYWLVLGRGLNRAEQGVWAGPFFSRERAEIWMRSNEHNIGKSAFVYCFSGHTSWHYRDLLKALPAPPKGDA